MTKFQKFRVPESLLYKCTLLIMTLPKRSNITVTLKFFFLQRNHTQPSLFGNQHRNFSHLPRMFPHDQNYATLC